MRNVSAMIAAAVMGIALYFAFTFGFVALQALASPAYGLDDIWHSQYIFTLGRMFGLSPAGLVKLAAFIAAAKLVAAGFCALHVIDRARGVPRTEFLEGAMILVAALALASLTPAAWSHGGDVIGESVLQLGIALFAIALCVAERRFDQRVEADALTETDGAYPLPN